MNGVSNNLLKYSVEETPKLHPYSADVSSPASAPETPNQLATDRATLAQEEEDAVQQQDSDEIGTETAFPPLSLLFFQAPPYTLQVDRSCEKRIEKSAKLCY